MKKLVKLVIVSILIVSLGVLAACDNVNCEAAEQGQRITCIESTPYGEILCDNRTGVVYFAYHECRKGYGGGIGYSGVCVMVDQNGKPLVIGENE